MSNPPWKYFLVVFLLSRLFECIFGNHDVPSPWFLSSTTFVSLPADERIIHSAGYNQDYLFLAGTNASNNLKFYQYSSVNRNLYFVNSLQLNTSNWNYDVSSSSAKAAATFITHPTTTDVYLVYTDNVGFNLIKIKQSDFVLSSINNPLTKTYDVEIERFSPSFLAANVEIEVGWHSNSNYLLVGAHGFQSGGNRWHVGVYDVSQAFPTRRSNISEPYRIHSIEFNCCGGGTFNARLLNSTHTVMLPINSVGVIGQPNAIAISTNSYVISYAVKDYGDQSSYFLTYEPSSSIFQPTLYRYSGSTVDEYPLLPTFSTPPDPRNLDIRVSGQSIYTAYVTTSSSIKSQWNFYDHVSSATPRDIVINQFRAADMSLQARLIYSYSGHDIIVRIEIDSDGSIFLMGTSDNLPANSNDRSFFVSYFKYFSIASIVTPPSITNAPDLRIGFLQDFNLTFSALPTNYSTSQVHCLFASVGCDNPRWTGAALTLRSPAWGVGASEELQVGLINLPHFPVVRSYQLSFERYNITSITPISGPTTGGTSLKVNVTNMFLGWLTSASDVVLKIGGRFCANVTTYGHSYFTCDVPVGVFGKFPITLEAHGNTGWSNQIYNFEYYVDADVRMQVAENGTTNVTLLCNDGSSRPAATAMVKPPSDNGILYSIDPNTGEKSNMMARDRFHNVSSTGNRVLFAAPANYRGPVVFPYECYYLSNGTKFKEATVAMTIYPLVTCKNEIQISGNIILSERDARKDNILFVITQIPAVGELLHPSNSSRISVGDMAIDNYIKYNTSVVGGRFNGGNITYYAIDGATNLMSDICSLSFIVSCAPKFLNVFRPETGELCETCPRGAVCSFNGEFDPYPDVGYWKSPDNLAFMPCHPASACPGSRFQTCGQEYQGVRCGECRKNFYRFDGECIPCRNDIGLTIFVLFVALMCGGGVVYLLLKVVANGPGLGLVSITLNFVQTILVLREINMKWTPEFDFVMNYLSFLNFNIELIAPECLASDEVLNYVFKMRITLAMPLILFGFLATVIILNHADVQEAIIYGVRPVVRKLKIPVQNQVNKVALQRTQKETILKAAKALNALLSLLYITVTTRTLGYFDCTKELDGFYYLDSDASFRCYDSRWMDHSAAAWLGLIFYVLGIPLYFMTFFFLLHQEKFSGAIWLKCKRKVKKIIDSDLNYIKPDYQYFMLLQILQKLTLICINIFFSKFVSVQILTSILVLLVAFNMYKKHCPYAYPTLNFLEIISVLSAKVVLALGLLLYTEQFESREMQFTITVFLLIFILGVIGVAIFCAFYEFYKGFRKIKFVDTLFTKVVPKSIRNDHRSQKRKMKSTTDLPIGDSQIMKSTQPK